MIEDLDKILDTGITHETKGAVTFINPSPEKLKLSNSELAQCDAWMKDQFRWMTQARKMWFGLEAIIGFGKSTFQKHILMDYITARPFYEETDSPFLKLFYHNLRRPQSKIGFFMQLYLAERRGDMGSEINMLLGESAAQDRTAPGEEVFIELLNRPKVVKQKIVRPKILLDEEAIWASKAVHKRISDVGIPNIHIILDAGVKTPEIAYSRVGKRGRDYETGAERPTTKAERSDMGDAIEILGQCAKNHIPSSRWGEYKKHLGQIERPKMIGGGSGVDQGYLEDQHAVLTEVHRKNLMKLGKRCYVVNSTVDELPQENDPRISTREKVESIRPVYHAARLLLSHSGNTLEDREDPGRRRIIGPYSQNPVKRNYQRN